jgi:hypothetical protein
MTLDRLLRHLVPAGLVLAAAAVIPAYAKKPAPLAQVTARHQEERRPVGL